MITQERLLPALPARPPRAVCLDRDRTPSTARAAPPWAAVTADNLVYVIDIGIDLVVPKGDDRSMRDCNDMFWRRAATLVLPAPIGIVERPDQFDDFVWQIFEPLDGPERGWCCAPVAIRKATTWSG